MTVSMNITFSLTKQNVNVFIVWECRRSCRYRTGTDQIISLQAKIRDYPRAMRSFSLILKDYAYSVSFMLFVYLCPFCWAGTFCKAPAEVWPQHLFIQPVLSQLVPHLIYLECSYMCRTESCQCWEQSTASSRRLGTLLSMPLCLPTTLLSCLTFLCNPSPLQGYGSDVLGICRLPSYSNSFLLLHCFHFFTCQHPY